MNSLASVVIPCYNAEQWLAQAIDSCVAQNYRPLEVIVVDDGSTDKGPDVAREYARKFPGLVRFHQQPNQGAPTARNAGAVLSRGAFLLFLDADDYLLSDALQHLVEALHESGDIAYGNAMFVDATGHPIGLRDQTPRSGDWVVVSIENNAITSSVLFRREVIETCQWDPALPCNQEYALHVNCAIHGFTFRFTSALIASIRQHDSPTRITNRTSSILAETLIDLHLYFQSELARRGSLDDIRKASLHYALLHDAISLWRFGRWDRARQVFSLVNTRLVRESHRFRYASYHGIAVTGGLRTSEIVWRSRQWVRQFAMRPERA
jgi:glycosyltransferase involved in cell wall biosynthesis